MDHSQRDGCQPPFLQGEGAFEKLIVVVYLFAQFHRSHNSQFVFSHLLLSNIDGICCYFFLDEASDSLAK